MKAVVKLGGERVDRIAKDLLGTEQEGAVAALFATNPGLAAACVHGIVPEGTVVIAPADFDPTPVATNVLAWE